MDFVCSTLFIRCGARADRDFFFDRNNTVAKLSAPPVTMLEAMVTGGHFKGFASLRDAAINHPPASDPKLFEREPPDEGEVIETVVVVPSPEGSTITPLLMSSSPIPPSTSFSAT